MKRMDKLCTRVVIIGIEVLAPEEQHVYSSQTPSLSRSVRSGMYSERGKAHGAPLERIAIGVVRL
jgi:hypothetical protein